MKRTRAYIRFELGGRTWTYTGTPNMDELSEAPWWTPRLSEIVERWFHLDNQANYLALINLPADEFLRRLLSEAGGRIVEVRSPRADGKVDWEDLPDFYIR